MRLHTDRRKPDDRNPIPATEVGSDPRRLDLARQQGDTYGAALELMATEVMPRVNRAIGNNRQDVHQKEETRP